MVVEKFIFDVSLKLMSHGIDYICYGSLASYYL